MLDNRVSSYAAVRIDGAIDVANKYIEKYLPSEDQIDCKYSLLNLIDHHLNSIEFHSIIHENEHFLIGWFNNG